MSNDNWKPKKGEQVELVGLISNPELNGCMIGIITKSEIDCKSGRWAVRLKKDGSYIAVKPSNIIAANLDRKLELALQKLVAAGGTEEEEDDDEEEEEVDDNKNYVEPSEYLLDELLAVGDARFDLEHYDKAASIFYRAYYIAMHKGNCINNPESFPVAHKMLQAYSKCEEEHQIRFGHDMAQQTLMMPGCPRYILQDKKDIEDVMRRKGIEIRDMMADLNRNMAQFGMGF
ncbi:hypothetical protein CTEN210_04192 [Chaetoceros tenuissimus]|uniref:Uncharacterized protein n=1 Tax=Chaetoceros tenuissimus TaxID=426638 RepID=A0AAD3H220_9STRA|nr:hypothetical protein CTEN210_04192 [Chaetoceros tenuissimus]